MYIRTNEGHIYEYIEQRIHTSQYTKFGLYRHNLNSEYEQIIAQVETIEELCDRFVRVIDDGTHIILSIKEGIKDTTLIKMKHIDYGAIWTSKGLIYVAKLNKDGELELI